MALSIVVLAAGQGTRMRSGTPKILHTLAGKPLLEHVVETIQKFDRAQKPLVVYGHEGETVQHALNALNVKWIEQTEQLGTGHALLQALPHLPKDNQVLVLYGDVPLISLETLKRFIDKTPREAIGIITAHFNNPHGLGRIIRDEKNKVIAITEEKDADETVRAIREINSGIYLIPSPYLQKWLPQLKNQNTQKEYYLTDIVPLAHAENIPIHTTQPEEQEEVYGVNDRIQLAQLERFYQQKQAEKFMRQGVTFRDPNRFDLRGELTVGRDVTIDINVIIEGQVKIGDHCTIGANSILRNVVLGNNVDIQPNSVMDGAEIANDCIIGPFARIRPGTVLAPRVQVGNFAEIKNSYIGEASKVHHVSYIGDTELGKKVNIGAGTITCNYDGVNKYRTIIGDNAFIGSNTSLVAPVTVGENAMIGAGSTIDHDAPAHELTLGRARQCTIEGWKRKTKEGT